MARAHSFQLRGSGRHHPDLQRESSTDSAESLEALAKTLKGGPRPGQKWRHFYSAFAAFVRALQRKGRWESNTNVWFPFVYSQKWNCYFQNRILMFCLPFPSLVYLWEIHIYPGSVCLFCCREICGPILGIFKSLTDTRMWKLGLRPRNSQKRNT